MDSPEAIVAAGHNQGAVSVEMNLQTQTDCCCGDTVRGYRAALMLRITANLQQKRGLNELATFSNTSQSSRPISVRSRQTGTPDKNGGKEKKQQLTALFKTHKETDFSAFHIQREGFSKRSNICSPFMAFFFFFFFCQKLHTHRSWHDEIGLGVEVAAEDIVAVTFQGF